MPCHLRVVRQGLSRAVFVITGAAIASGIAACLRMPIPTPVAIRVATPLPVTTPQVVVVAEPWVTVEPTPPPETQTANQIERPVRERSASTLPRVPSFLQQRITALFDLARLPALENSVATQFTSRNWTSLEHYFDYFIDDGNFVGPNYGYVGEDGTRAQYRIVTGYDGAREYEIVPRVPGPGSIDRIWFAYQQHQSVNNPKDMSQVAEWNNWGNLGQMGNIRFYFDDEPVPRIDFSIKDLFVGKNPFPAPLAAFYASANGGNINYVPIPFQRSIRVTTTGRPRLMQVQVKRFISGVVPASSANAGGTSDPATHSSSTEPVNRENSVQAFNLNLSPNEQTALDQTAQAWQTCTPAQSQDYKSFPLGIPHNNSAEVDFNAPATIDGLRVRVPRGMDDSVWMQVFWDGETEPSMAAPLRGMFGTAERLLPYRALPMGIIANDTELVFYNNFPMPFRSARIVFINHRAEALPITLEVATRETTPGTENARLRAFYGTRRMERRETNTDNYAVIDVKGSGKYLGTIFSAWDLDRRALNGPLDEHWRFPYLESNMDVWVDGRLALPGTGIEDDFNASYYYVYYGYAGYQTTYCLAGVTLLDYNSPKEPSSQYRFYLNDAPEFRNHLRVEAEHGNKGNNLSVTYSSTAFWYQIR